TRFIPAVGAVDTAALLGFWGDVGQTGYDHIEVTLSDTGTFDADGTPVLVAHVLEEAVAPACFAPLQDTTPTAYVKYVLVPRPFTGDQYDPSCPTGAIHSILGTHPATTGAIHSVLGTQSTGAVQTHSGQAVYVKAMTSMPFATMALAYQGYQD